MPGERLWISGYILYAAVFYLAPRHIDSIARAKPEGKSRAFYATTYISGLLQREAE